MNFPKISVIIATFNRAEMVCSCIRSVLATNYPALEVIVVDDCSQDDTKDKITALFGTEPRLTYARNDKNSFQAVSRNRGRALATGKFLFFLDDDNIVHNDIFAALTSAFEKQPKAGLIAPMAIHQRRGADNLIWSLGSDFNRWTSQPKDFRANLPLDKLPTTPLLYPTTYYPNAFMVPASVFDQVNGFDECYGQIFEESDLGWRITKKGYKAFITINARTDHFGFIEPTCEPKLRLLGIEKPRRTYYFARNRIRFARRHFNVFQKFSVALIFAPLSAVYYCSIAIFHRRLDIAWAYLKGTFHGIIGFYE